jgi:hypothetical protein
MRLTLFLVVDSAAGLDPVMAHLYGPAARCKPKITAEV